MTPEALRRRMAHGNIYQPEKIDAALGNYFRVGNLTALRELALLWLADKVDEQLDRYRDRPRHRHHLGDPRTGRGRPDRRPRGRHPDPPGRPDRRPQQGRRPDGRARRPQRRPRPAPTPPLLARQRVLVESLGGTYHQVVGADVPRALLDFARGVNATQLVLGASRRGRLAQLFSRRRRRHHHRRSPARSTCTWSPTNEIGQGRRRRRGRRRARCPGAVGSPASRSPLVGLPAADRGPAARSAPTCR